MEKMYYYNDILLPEPQGWDKERYPYACLAHNSRGDSSAVFVQYLFCVSSEPHFSPNPNSGFWGVDYDDAYIRYKNSGWEEVAQDDNHNSVITIFVWSNYDILNEDGSVYLPASDPVPVGGEPEEPEQPESVLAWRKHDAYKPNTKWNGHTFYKVIGNKWVKHDAVVPTE